MKKSIKKLNKTIRIRFNKMLIYTTFYEKKKKN